MKIIKEKSTYILLRIISSFVNFIPLFLGYKLADLLGIVIYKYLKTYQRIININLNVAFPEKTKKEKKQIAIKTCQVFCKIIFMGLKLPYLTKKGIDNLVEFPDYNSFKEKAKNGAIFLSAHFGNYELLAAYISLQGFPFGVVYRPIENKVLDKYLKITREKVGLTLISRGEFAKDKCRKILQEKKYLAFANDQNAGPSGIMLNFFNKPASTFKGFADIALEFNTPIIPIFSVISGTKLIVFWEDYMKIPSTGDKKQDAIILTQQYLTILEKYIKKYPEQYFWLHKRWKGTVEY